MNYSKFDPKLLYNIPKGYNCTMLNKAVAELDIDLVKNILASGEVDVHELNNFAILKLSGEKPGHLKQHFQSIMKTTVISQLFEKDDILEMNHENLVITSFILQV